MATALTTRPLEGGDIEPVLELMRLALGEPPLLRRTPALFRWKHMDNPFGQSIALLAVEGDRVVGLRTFMRWELVTPNDEILQCIRAVDTATHPDHRRKGIFRRLTEEALEIAIAEGVDMVFNTPNSQSKPGYLKMGWLEVGAIGAMVRPSLALAGDGKGQDLADPNLFLTNPTPFGSFSAEDRSPLGLRTPRKPSYLEWRFASHPSARYYETSMDRGMAILRPNIRRGRRELVVAEAIGDPRSAMASAVRARGSAYLATWFSTGSPERRAAVRAGFVPLPGFTALTLVMRPLKELPDSYLESSAWDLAVGDLELL